MRDVFANRTEAGRLLARALAALTLVDPVVLALPRGGVPVAAEVADALHAPLDLLLVRKIGAPGQRELAVAAIAEGPHNEPVIDRETLYFSGATMDYVERQAEVERLEIERRRAAYLRGRPPLPVEGKTAVLVDDGIATGTTVRAALRALRRRRPARLVLAVPVAPAEAVAALRGEVDDLVCLSQPAFFRAVGVPYVDFHQVEDDEVIGILDTHWQRASPATP
ncbi:phosphoribosyltransferase [Azohydromonas caseinilytica]|uniref:Phosphoribosyltransferase n=1 Tax=Azohydromonas caseinilytica TaxID=2728836 RepID=A0A848FDD4_9BURK|nr:phosphoribosyltransferase family protein [Azohydromonas caseinilytica]NML18217.1 phosphoribosyltransferase [Azohydromonas caseinilytica]